MLNGYKWHCPQYSVYPLPGLLWVLSKLWLNWSERNINQTVHSTTLVLSIENSQHKSYKTGAEQKISPCLSIRLSFKWRRTWKEERKKWWIDFQMLEDSSSQLFNLNIIELSETRDSDWVICPSLWRDKKCWRAESTESSACPWSDTVTALLWPGHSCD